MNHITIIGNLVGNPELRTTQQGVSVCTFGVAVNRRRSDGVDFFRVSAWRGLGENCAKYLSKGKKVAVTGAVSVSTYKASNGEARANLEVNADDVEFLTPKGEQEQSKPKAPDGFVEVTGEELPWD